MYCFVYAFFYINKQLTYWGYWGDQHHLNHFLFLPKIFGLSVRYACVLNKYSIVLTTA